jgi:tryptophan synthase alpha chain
MSIANPKSKIQNRIDDIFADLRAHHRAALMPFVTAGFPSLEVTERVLPMLERAGASIVELGIPFSDPIADGPVIAQSMHAALQAGVTPHAVFEMVKRVRPHTQLGLLAMVSDSIITRMLPERFVTEAADAGFDGLIVPDIDLEASRPLSGLARIHDLSFTLLIAPTTTPQRLASIVELCTGFMYVLARVGITGEREAIDASALAERVALVREHTDLPIAVGFGISRAEHVTKVTRHADAAIVGSALVRRMGESSDPASAAAKFVRELAGGLRRE